MPQSLATLHVHLVFSTKNREHCLPARLRTEINAYMATVLGNLNCPATIVNCVADHVHILFSLARTVTLSKAVEAVKRSSSKWLKSRLPVLSNFAWQSGYGAFSVSQSNIEEVRAYIEGQEEHHQTKSFKQEYLAFLTRNKIDYDDQYLWD